MKLTFSENVKSYARAYLLSAAFSGRHRGTAALLLVGAVPHVTLPANQICRFHRLSSATFDISARFSDFSDPIKD